MFKFIICFVSSVALSVQMGQEVPKLVALFSKLNSIEEQVIDFAYDEYRQSLIGPMGSVKPAYGSEFILEKFHIDPTDMVNISFTLCKKLNESEVALVYSGTSTYPIPSIIQSYVDAFETGHVTFQTATDNSRASKMFQVQPKLSRAVHELIRLLRWKKFAVIYDEKDILESFTSVSEWTDSEKACGKRVDSNKCALLQPRLKYVFSDRAISNSLAEIKKQGETNIVLFLSRDHTQSLFEMALKWQMLTQDYTYIIADLRMPCRKVRFDISGKINITCFQLVEQSSPEFESFSARWRRKNLFKLDLTNELETALAYDAFSLMRTVLTSLHMDNEDLLKYRAITAVNAQTKMCLGLENVMNPVRKLIRNKFYKVKISGVTGNIEFDEFGNRRNFQLQLLDVGFMQVHNRVGNWSEVTGKLELEPDYAGLSGDETGIYTNKTMNELINIQQRPMRVTAVLSKPFTMLKKEFIYMENNTLSVRKEHLEGFLIDVLSRACSKLNLDYDIRLVKDGRYGAKNHDGTWNGMIGELLRGEADVALAPLTITLMRQQVVDFTKPYMTLGISIMMQKPQDKGSGIFSFLQPLHTEIWLCCILAYFSVSVVLFLVSRISTFHEHREAIRKNSEGQINPDEEEPFGIINCLWFSLGSFMQQGGDICPKSMPSRIVACSWWFFTLIIISSYTANLAAFLTVDRMKSPISGAEDLAAQTHIEYGTLDQSSSQIFFEGSKVSTYQRMYAFMKDRHLFTESTAEGVKRVQENPNFAFLMESIMMDYYNNQEPCNTIKVGPNLNVINYGLATPRDSPYLKILTIAVLELQENNEIELLKDKWWYLNSPCSSAASKSGPSKVNSAAAAAALKLERVSGIFYLLGGTLIVGFIVAFLELLYVSFCQASYLKVSTIRVVKANLRQAVTSNSK